MKSRVTDYAVFTGSAFPKFYREQFRSLKSIRKKKVDETSTIRKVASTIFEEIGLGVTESIAGVKIDRLGYFSVWRVNSPIINKGRYTTISLNTHSDGYQYVLDFFPETSTNHVLKDVAMDRTYNSSVKKRLSKNLKKGYKYMNYLTMLLGSKKAKLSI